MRHSLAGLSFMLVMLTLTEPGQAQIATGAGAFTRMGPSARAIAFGRAYVSLATQDPLGVFWTASSVAGSSELRVGVTNRIAGGADIGIEGASAFSAVAVTGPAVGGLSFGIGVLHLGISGIRQYSNEANFQGEFSDSELLGVVCIGRQQGPIRSGISVRFIRQGFDGLQDWGQTQASGFGLEAGMTAQFWERVQVAASLAEEVDLERDRVPMRGLLGASYVRPVSIGATTGTLVTALDLEQVKERPARVHVGLGLEQVKLRKGFDFALRFGRSNRMLEPRVTDNLAADFKPLAGDDYVSASAQWTLGFGVRRGNVVIDYAMAFGRVHDLQYMSVGYQP
jgi:hypothetical protein